MAMSIQGTLTHTLSGSLQTLTSVDFNETEELLLGSCMDNSTRIWDLATGRIRVNLQSIANMTVASNSSFVRQQ